jgi:hypothetical protein
MRRQPGEQPRTRTLRCRGPQRLSGSVDRRSAVQTRRRDDHAATGYVFGLHDNDRETRPPTGGFAGRRVDMRRSSTITSADTLCRRHRLERRPLPRSLLRLAFLVGGRSFTF